MQGELRQVADLALFAKIVQTGGISKCADDLGMERTTISRRLGALERTLGVKLLDRTPKHLAVTAAGLRCLKHCEMLLESARNAHSLATIGSIINNSAPIVIGAPPDIIDRYLEAQIVAFEKQNPGLQIERQPVAPWSRSAVEGVDLGIALGPVSVSAGWSKKIGEVRQSVFASADYATQHKPLHTPFDIQSHDCIAETADDERHCWRFIKNHKITTVTIRPKHTVSGLLEAREATLAGLGICCLPQYLCESHVRTGQLVDLMPDVESLGRDVVMLGPRRKHRKSGVTSLRVHLSTAFG